MAVTKIRKISSWTLLIVMTISVAVLGLFYFGGVEDPNAEMKAPIYTEHLLYWAYFVFAVTVVLLLVFGVFQFASTLKTKPKAAIGSLMVIVVFVVMLGITYMIGDATPLNGINADSAHYNVPVWLKISDMWIYSIYILLGMCILAVIGGSLSKVLNK